MLNFRNYFFLIAFIFASLNADISIKQQAWDQLAEEVDTWCDGLGYPMDEGIKEAVIALNLLGFTTRQSCEGHLDHGFAFPWIDFEATDPALVAIDRQITALLDAEVRPAYDLLRKKYPKKASEKILLLPEAKQLNVSLEKYKKLCSLFIERAEVIYLPLVHLIEDFYQLHIHSQDIKLTLNIERIISLQSQGGILQANRSKSERKKHLKLYAQEMKAFTRFLKALYFQH